MEQMRNLNADGASGGDEHLLDIIEHLHRTSVIEKVKTGSYAFETVLA